MAGLRAEQLENLVERTFHLCRLLRRPNQCRSKRSGNIGHQLLRHFIGRQYIIHQARRDRTPGHAVVFCGFRLLHHHQSTLALHRTHAEGTITPGAGEHDANSMFSLILSQRAEENIDGQPHTTRRRSFGQMQVPVRKRHVSIGRNNVGAVRMNRHSVLHFKHLHLRVAADQLRKDALVVAGQMLHQHKGHARLAVCRHRGEKRLEGTNASGGSAYTNDGESQVPAPLQRFRSVICFVHRFYPPACTTRAGVEACFRIA